ncbi:threonine--tRNA ligase [Halomonas elongata]|uniref:Threonine--tRNA ligase n=1 Tax=Halomonas elongata TaxID=2746 RepID=A0A1B8P2G9_HALEL|nr:threonine--tRNA ligase [Halomonas elongata]
MIGHAVKQLYPDAKMAIGPVIEDGFYYDIDFGRSITPEDLEAIEARMKSLIETGYDVVREYVDRDRAMLTFLHRDEPYKQEIVREIPKGRRSASIITRNTPTCVGGLTSPIPVISRPSS